MPETRRGRPPKPESERLQPVTINICPADFDALCSLARAQREYPAVVLRELALQQLHESAQKS